MNVIVSNKYHGMLETLDIDTKNIIADAINEYNGTILLVSHDALFVEKLNITRMLILPKGIIEYFDKNKVIDK